MAEGVTNIRIPDAAKECAYCLCLKELRPRLGTELVFLKGHDAGYVGIVHEDKWGTCPPDRFLVRMEYEQREGNLRMVMPEHDRFLEKRLLNVPPWMPPLSIDDNSELHDCLTEKISELALAEDREALAECLRTVIGVSWWKRFPIDGTDIWSVLEAHGAQSHLKSDGIQLFDFGLKLLLDTQGRRPVKMRRMIAMSQGRYLAGGQKS